MILQILNCTAMGKKRFAKMKYSLKFSPNHDYMIPQTLCTSIPQTLHTSKQTANPLKFIESREERYKATSN